MHIVLLATVMSSGLKLGLTTTRATYLGEVGVVMIPWELPVESIQLWTKRLFGIVRGHKQGGPRETTGGIR